jgi:hypothetical protein
MNAAYSSLRRRRSVIRRGVSAVLSSLLIVGLIHVSAHADSVATPTITSYSLHNATLNQGDTIAIDYAATDVGPALHQVLFTYTDACGQGLDVAVTSNSGLSDTGTVTQLITNAQRNGPYTLQTMHLEDLAGDKISYHRDGTTDSQAAGGQLPNGTHDFDFSSADFTVGGQGTCKLSVSNGSVASISSSSAVGGSLQRANMTALSPAAGGTITSSPAGISCGSVCSFGFPAGTPVILTATPDATSIFSGWSGGGCSGTGTCQVIMDRERSVTAAFDVKPSVTARGKLHRYYASSGGERLYHLGRDVHFQGWVIPNRAGHTLYITWQKRNAGIWKHIATRSVTIPSSGVVHIAIPADRLHLRTHYRIRCVFKTGSAYLGDTSAWRHFRVMD